MKNTKIIISVIIGFLFGICVTVCASALYNSQDISYTTSYNDKVTNVQEALDYLYEKDSGYTNFILFNGASIEKDSNNDYYINFDGVDDYAQLGVLPASINWKDGFTVEFTAEWDAFNLWSRIFDFGNGSSSDNIAIANTNTINSLVLTMYNGSNENPVTSSSENFIIQNEKHNYKIEYKKNESMYLLNYYKDNDLIDSKGFNFSINNINRNSNYLGRSNWSTDGYFKGRIYSLKIDQIDGTNIVNININAQNK